ncbi:retrotransposable element Tf2 [Tanacetum coccineum]|uniref:Retrotransposable element Tf2 n=1 Tax=Tanacetum coccineum TaxID=301880 RepID=A0ABQ5IMG3_9ASTR
MWSSISMDFVEGLPKSQGKNVIMIDQVFLDNIYKLHGLPESMVSDKDKVFISVFWKELFKLLHVKLLMPTAYHPQTDGKTKVVNRSLECYLRCMCGEKPKEWSKWLSLAEWWYNTNYHTALNTTPYEILYGQTPPIYIPYVSGESRVDTVDNTLSAREEVNQALRFRLKRLQERVKTQADKHISEREFAVARSGSSTQCDNNGLIQAQPVAILDRRLGKVGNTAGVFILVQWSNSDPADVTWEPIEDIQRRFPEFNMLN